MIKFFSAKQRTVEMVGFGMAQQQQYLYSPI
jgi:hypothetical protein